MGAGVYPLASLMCGVPPDLYIFLRMRAWDMMRRYSVFSSVGPVTGICSFLRCDIAALKARADLMCHVWACGGRMSSIRIFVVRGSRLFAWRSLSQTVFVLAMFLVTS